MAAADFEQRPHQMLLFLFRKNSSQTQGAGAAQDAHQHGFGLIVERVRRGDLVRFAFVHELEKPTVAQLASAGFETGLAGPRVGGRIARAQVEVQLEAAGQVLDELLVGIGLSAANAVMEMRHGKHDSQLAAQLQQSAQQRYRVRAA